MKPLGFTYMRKLSDGVYNKFRLKTSNRYQEIVKQPIKLLLTFTAKLFLPDFQVLATYKLQIWNELRKSWTKIHVLLTSEEFSIFRGFR